MPPVPQSIQLEAEFIDQDQIFVSNAAKELLLRGLQRKEWL